MWDQTYGCVMQYRCSIAYYLIFFLSKSYQHFIYKAFDAPGHVKDLVDGFNAFQKQYLATCLRMRMTSEVDNIDSKRMRVDSMTKKGEVNFSEECKRLLDVRD